ncbi:helix-turn-helix transcriptional regulator [Ferdinandcohnia sp. Marseille-Q9671]
MDELLSKCWLIKNTFHIDVQVIDEHFQTVFHISNDNDPLIISDAQKIMLQELLVTLKESPTNSFCFHTNSFQLSYLAVPLYEEDVFRGIVSVGPFLNEKVTDDFIWNILKSNDLEHTWIKPLTTFYQSLAYLAHYYLAVGDLLVNIFKHPHVESHIVTVKNRNAQHHSTIQPQDFDESGFDIKMRYEKEKILLHYIEVGDKENAIKAMIEFTGDFLYRVPGNPLRAKKNITLSLNTMMRMASARGGVEPQYVHAISDKFARKIEESVAMSDLDSIALSMIEEYCEAVQNFAVKGHSSIVRKALVYINLYFKEPISLQMIADEIGVNRSYLAKKFKSEMNISVVDYIHKKRIEEATFLLGQGRLSITEIGIEVGFSSYNYFCKVFKEVKGMTATEYREGIHKEEQAHD